MSKKKIHDTTKVENELSESLFFKKKPLSQRSPQASNQPTTNRQVAQSDARPPQRPPERVTKNRLGRESFEIYNDQMETLRRYSLEEKARGELGSMSAMVRTALDAYFKQRQTDEGERPNGRASEASPDGTDVRGNETE